MIETLHNVVDKLGRRLAIMHTNVLGGSPVVPHFLRNYSELIELGQAHPQLAGSNKSKAIYITHDNAVVAYIVYDTQDDCYKTAFILMTYVAEDYRSSGIYRLLNKHFEVYVRNAGSKKCTSLVHVTNETSYSARKSIGYSPVFYRMEKEL